MGRVVPGRLGPEAFHGHSSSKPAGLHPGGCARSPLGLFPAAGHRSADCSQRRRRSSGNAFGAGPAPPQSAGAYADLLEGRLMQARQRVMKQLKRHTAARARAALLCEVGALRVALAALRDLAGSAAPRRAARCDTSSVAAIRPDAPRVDRPGLPGGAQHLVTRSPVARHSALPPWHKLLVGAAYRAYNASQHWRGCPL